MKDRELRLGNIISYRGEKWAIVSSLGSYGFETVNNYDVMPIGSGDLNEYEPIVLTDELMIKAGGIRDNDNSIYIQLPDCCDVRLYLSDGFIQRCKSSYCVLSNYCHIQYLHQLQNLYFFLTGQELTINI